MVLAREESADIPEIRHSLYLSALQGAVVMVELGASRDWDTQNCPGIPTRALVLWAAIRARTLFSEKCSISIVINDQRFITSIKEGSCEASDGPVKKIRNYRLLIIKLKF